MQKTPVRFLCLCLCLCLIIPCTGALAEPELSAEDILIYHAFLDICETLELLTVEEYKTALRVSPKKTVSKSSDRVSFDFYPFAGVSRPAAGSLPDISFQVNYDGDGTLRTYMLSSEAYNYEPYSADTLPIAVLVAFLFALSDDTLSTETVVGVAAQLVEDAVQNMESSDSKRMGDALYKGGQFLISYHILFDSVHVMVIPLR